MQQEESYITASQNYFNPTAILSLANIIFTGPLRLMINTKCFFLGKEYQCLFEERTLQV